LKDSKRKLDQSKSFGVILAVELPFWVSIESGEYNLPNEQELKLRNDLWLLSIGNIVDDPPNMISFFIMNEEQIENQDILSRLIVDSPHHHKRKMKTTLTCSLSIIPYKGTITANPNSDEWIRQIEKVTMNVVNHEKYHAFLQDINTFIDYYTTIIGPASTFGELRHVGFFDVKFRILLIIDNNGMRTLRSLTVTPDIRMADIPYPPFRVCKEGNSQRFREAIKKSNPPVFHQREWARILNHFREGRMQEALLSCAIVLEALSYAYWGKKAIQARKEGIKRGIAGWLRSRMHPKLQDEFDKTAELWDLRNVLVHDQPQLTEKDFQIIKAGIKTMGQLRPFFLQKIAPHEIDLRKEFAAFLEPTYMITADESVGKSVPIAIQWRREKDHYEERA